MEHRSRRLLIPILAVVLGLTGAACGKRGAGGEATTATTQAPTPVSVAPNMSTVAQAKVSSVKVYGKPDATGAATHTLANPIKSGAPLVFLVRKTEGEWLEVDLPVRPNGSVGWVRSADVTTTQHDYRIVVEVAAHKITVFKGQGTLLTEPVALGRGNTPTPGGRFFIRELLQPPDPTTVYGPYAYGLSGFSETLTTFAGGDAIIGIHGNNDPSTLGKDVSAGCIRMSNPGITMLAKVLPLGTPVEILK